MQPLLPLLITACFKTANGALEPQDYYIHAIITPVPRINKFEGHQVPSPSQASSTDWQHKASDAISRTDSIIASAPVNATSAANSFFSGSTSSNSTAIPIVASSLAKRDGWQSDVSGAISAASEALKSVNSVIETAAGGGGDTTSSSTTSTAAGTTTVTSVITTFPGASPAAPPSTTVVSGSNSSPVTVTSITVVTSTASTSTDPDSTPTASLSKLNTAVGAYGTPSMIVGVGILVLCGLFGNI